MPMIDDMLIKAFARLDAGINPVLHSDQGWQYRHRWYQYQLREFGVLQSMLRKGNCLDNACAECFFGTLKSECFYTSKFKDIDELKLAIEDYIRYYNTRRISLKFNGLSPVEYRLKSYQAEINKLCTGMLSGNRNVVGLAHRRVCYEREAAIISCLFINKMNANKHNFA